MPRTYVPKNFVWSVDHKKDLFVWTTRLLGRIYFLKLRSFFYEIKEDDLTNIN